MASVLSKCGYPAAQKKVQTYIISSKNLEKGKEEALTVIQTEKVHKFDIEVLGFEKALGIEDVRTLQKKIFLAPLKGEKKATIMALTNGATVEAQNSMLKLLEEPPKSSLIFLITNNYHTFLPTILSRCKLIDLDLGIKPVVNKDHSNILKNLRMTSPADALKLAQDISGEKEGAIVWLEETILAVREEMLAILNDKQEALRLRKLIHRLELTHYDLKTTNVNPRLALENLFLNI